MAERGPNEKPDLRVRDVESPLPRSSFGSIERYVEVGADGERGFEPGTITIEYSPEQLGWVDPETLRVFRLDVEAREWELVPDSGPDGRGAVRADVRRPGIYGVVGLPGHSAVLEAVRRVCRLPSAELPGEHPWSGLPSICLEILCTPDVDRWSDGSNRPLLPPGGFGDSVCDFCAGLQPLPGGLPECRLLATPEPPAAETSPEAGRAYAVTALSWFGLILPYGGGGFPSWVEVFDLDPPTPTASYDIGLRWCTSLAVSSAGGRLYVTDVSGPEVAAYDSAGQLVGSVPLPHLGGGALLDCALSPDDAALYVAASDALFVIDTASLTVSDVVSTDEYMGGLAVSADGSTVAAAGAAGLHLVDTGTLAHRSMAWPAAFRALNWVYSVDVAFVDASRVLAWGAGQGVLLDINLRSGGVSSLSTSAALTGGPMFNNSLLFAPGSGNAYVARLTSSLTSPPGAPFRSDVLTFDINGGTWSSHQFQGYLTIPALTLSERILVVETQIWSESLRVYDPGTQQLSADLCAVPFPNVVDLKVVSV
jgi:hypothetical protein